MNKSTLATAKPKPARTRRRPVQDRSKATVAKLLDALGDHLAENGFRTLNTNVIAARAGVGVATLYAYFPDIFAMLEAYADRSLAVWLELWKRYPSFEHAPGGTWRDSYRVSLQATIDHAKEDYAYVLIISAYGVVPELDETLRKIRAAHVAEAVGIFEHAGLRLPRAQAEAAATTIIDAGWIAILHLAREDNPVLQAEYERLIVSYMANFLDPIQP